MRTCGIDVSSKSCGYAIIDNDQVMLHGKIHFGSGSPQDRIFEAVNRLSKFARTNTYDVLSIEDIPYVNNQRIYGTLSMFYGLSVGLLYKPESKLILPRPLIWQQYIGNSLLTKSEKDDIIRQFPRKSKSWYTDKFRQARKQRTIEWVHSRYNIILQDDDIGDAIGIAHYGYTHVQSI